MAKLADVLRVEWAPAADPLTELDTAAADWVDITDRVVSVNTNSGWGSVFDLFASSQATIVLNNGNRTGQTQLLDPSSWYRWRQVRICAPHSVGVAPTWGAFHGYIKTVKHDQQNAPAAAQVTLTCVDRFGLAGSFSLPGDDPNNPNSVAAWFGPGAPEVTDDADRAGYVYPVGFGQYGGAHDIWDYVAFVTGMATTTPERFSVAGTRVFIPKDLTGNALQVLQDYLECERARLCTDPLTGLIRYLGRWAQIQAAADGAQWVFSDTPGVGEYRIMRDEFDLAEPGTDYYTQAVYKDVFNPPVTVDNTPAGYPPDVLSRANLPLGDPNWAKANADMVVAVYSAVDTFPQRLRYLTWSVGASVSASQPTFARLGLDALTVEFTSVGGAQQSWLLLVEGIEHRITPERWDTTFRLSNLDRWVDAYGSDGLFVIDTSAPDGPEIIAP